MDESEEAGSELIETGGDPSELLELEEEGFGVISYLYSRRTHQEVIQ